MAISMMSLSAGRGEDLLADFEALVFRAIAASGLWSHCRCRTNFLRNVAAEAFGTDAGGGCQPPPEAFETSLMEAAAAGGREDGSAVLAGAGGHSGTG